MGLVDFGNFLTGFNNQSNELRQEEQKRADHQWDLNRRTLEWLATSDDPEIRTAAITGILDQNGPKPKKGLAGWFGEVQAHPAFNTLHTLLNTPVTEQQTRTFPNPEAPQAPTPIAQAGAPGRMVADPSLGPDQPLPSTVQPPPSLRTMPTQTESRTVTHRREAFMSPAQRIAEETRAQYSGKLGGLIGATHDAGVDLSPSEIQDVALGMAGSPRRQNQYEAKFVQFRDGSTGPVGFDRGTSRYIGSDGRDVTADIVKELPRGSGAANRPIVKTQPNGDGTYSYVEERQQPDGSWIQIDMGEAPAPPASIVQGSDQYYKVPRGDGKPVGTGIKPRAGGGSGTGSTPEERAAKAAVQTISHDLDAIEREGRLGGITSQGQLDKAAKRRGYQNYKDARAKFEAAKKAAGMTTSTRGAGGEVAGPPAPSSAPSTGGFGTPGGADVIRRFLPQR